MSVLCTYVWIFTLKLLWYSRARSHHDTRLLACSLVRINSYKRVQRQPKMLMRQQGPSNIWEKLCDTYYYRVCIYWKHSILLSKHIHKLSVCAYISNICSEHSNFLKSLVYIEDEVKTFVNMNYAETIVEGDVFFFFLRSFFVFIFIYTKKM